MAKTCTSLVLLSIAELWTFTDLPDGIQCMLPYYPDEMLQCGLYGAVFNITTPSSEDTTTISPGNSSTLKHTEATESLESSSTSQSITATSAECSTSKKWQNYAIDVIREDRERENCFYNVKRIHWYDKPNKWCDIS